MHDKQHMFVFVLWLGSLVFWSAGGLAWSQERTSKIAGNATFTLFQEKRSEAEPSERWELIGYVEGSYKNPIGAHEVRLRMSFAMPRGVGDGEGQGRLDVVLPQLPKEGTFHRYKVGEKGVVVAYVELKKPYVLWKGKATQGEFLLTELVVTKESLYRMKLQFWVQIEDGFGRHFRLFRRVTLTLDVRTPIAKPSTSSTSSTQEPSSRSSSKKPSWSRSSRNRTRRTRHSGGGGIDGEVIVGCGGGGGEPILDGEPDSEFDADDDPDNVGCHEGDPMLDGQGDPGEDEDDEDEEVGCADGDPILDDDGSGGVDEWGDSSGSNDGSWGSDDDGAIWIEEQARLQRRRLRRQWSRFVQFGIPCLWLVGMRIRRRKRNDGDE